MSWRVCERGNCSTRVRAGLVRHGVGVHGQPLADGRHCAPCRRKMAPAKSPTRRIVKKDKRK